MEGWRRGVSHLQRTSAKGRYYTRNRLWNKVTDLLDWAGVRDLWNIQMEVLDEECEPDEKVPIKLQFSPGEVAIRRRKAMEERFVLATSCRRRRRARISFWTTTSV